MPFRVQCNMIFLSEDEARDTYHDLELALTRAVTLNPFLTIRQTSTIEWHECSHVDDTTTPCTILATQETP